MRSRYLVTRPRISDRTRIRHQDQEEGGEGETERMVPQETSMQGAGMGAGGRLDQVCVVRSSLFFVATNKVKISDKNFLTGGDTARTRTRAPRRSAASTRTWSGEQWGTRGSQADHAD